MPKMAHRASRIGEDALGVGRRCVHRDEFAPLCRDKRKLTTYILHGVEEILRRNVDTNAICISRRAFCRHDFALPALELVLKLRLEVGVNA